MGKIAHLLDTTITLASEASRNNYGDPTFGAQSTVAARVELTDQLVIGTDGNEVRANHVVYTETAITYTDQIWLSTADETDDNEALRPLLIKNANFPDGTVGHYEVFL